ncbi:MAG: hypothetical protein ABEJ30_06875 [Halorientalis sp.]
MTSRGVATVLLAFLVVLAGCGGLPGEGSPSASEVDSPGPDRATPAGNTDGSPTATPSPGTPTVSERLGVDVARTFQRVLALTGTDVARRPVRIGNLSEGGRHLSGRPSRLNRALGFAAVQPNWSRPTGLTPPRGPVVLHPGDGSSGAVERTLAHEFTHVVQYERGMLPDWTPRTTDRRKTLAALREGGAVYVADVYAHRYLAVRNNSALVRELRRRSPTHRSALAPYHFGARYVAARIDDPAALPTVYRSPPRTTEQVIHGGTPATHPEGSLSVTLEPTATNWTRAGTDTVGEMTTRTALATELAPDVAARAAAGWGTDRLLTLHREADVGWAWVHRWDAAGEATAAETALRTYASRRDASSRLDFRAVRVGNRTTALLFGPPALVSGAHVTGEPGNVTVVMGRLEVRPSGH